MEGETSCAINSNRQLNKEGAFLICIKNRNADLFLKRRKMKKSTKRESPVIEQVEESKPDLAVIIGQMQQQLVSLEKKIDALINKPAERHSEEQRFSKPFRSFGNSFRNDRGRQDSNPRERTFFKDVCAECNTECEVPFKPSGDRPVYCKDCFSKRKSSDSSFAPRRDSAPMGRNFPPKRHFDKPQGEDSRGDDRKRKPAFKRRKKSA